MNFHFPCIIPLPVLSRFHPVAFVSKFNSFFFYLLSFMYFVFIYFPFLSLYSLHTFARFRYSTFPCLISTFRSYPFFFHSSITQLWFPPTESNIFPLPPLWSLPSPNILIFHLKHYTSHVPSLLTTHSLNTVLHFFFLHKDLLVSYSFHPVSYYLHNFFL